MPRGPQGKLLPLYLEPDLYRRLDQQAKADEREVTQQARFIIRRHLESAASDSRDPEVLAR